jgi:lipopolysaccharide/colanic/teichoic acid biosynthesis glycosyltransferase
MLFSLPLIGLIAAAIKLDSKGPVFFKQDRCGEDCRVFQLYKFRSMVDNAEAHCGPRWATEDDRRVTRVGKMLRKYRVDEIPQLWNVLKGDMSFVGPRPERPEFVKRLGEKIPYYLERHTVKPGITGWAQVSYRYGSSVEDSLEKFKYDLFYIKNMSLAMDLMIMFKTAKIVLLSRGAR